MFDSTMALANIVPENFVRPPFVKNDSTLLRLFHLFFSVVFAVITMDGTCWQFPMLGIMRSVS